MGSPNCCYYLAFRRHVIGCSGYPVWILILDRLMITCLTGIDLFVNYCFWQAFRAGHNTPNVLNAVFGTWNDT